VFLEEGGGLESEKLFPIGADGVSEHRMALPFDAFRGGWYKTIQRRPYLPRPATTVFWT